MPIWEVTAALAEIEEALTAGSGHQALTILRGHLVTARAQEEEYEAHWAAAQAVAHASEVFEDMPF
jgi:hypothetical protein